jgi:hypothetical protein
MIRTIVTHTIEPVDIEFALDEITAQLGEKGPLLSHTIGLLFCNFEFIQSGLVHELCGRLPFDIAGCTSQAFAVPGAGEEFMLTLMVLTSDDVEFHAGFSEPLSAGNEAALEKLYLDLLSQGKGASAGADAPAAVDPALMFVFPPFLTDVTGNTVVSVLDRVSGGLPIFGSAAIDITTDLRSPMTIFNGEHSPDRVPLVLLRGNVQPKFFSCSLPGEVRFSQHVKITKAKGNRIVEIDNRPAVEFVEKLGLIHQGVAEVLYAFPIVVDYHDGTEPRIFTVSKIDTDGSLVSEQDIPVGGTVNIGTIGGDLVIESTHHLLDQIMETPPQNGLILVSCISRILTLRDSLEEIDVVQRRFRDLSMPYVLFSSGGEVCPLYRSPQDKPMNAFHQYTIIACII